MADSQQADSQQIDSQPGDRRNLAQSAMKSVWIEGTTRSGKTQRLVEWVQQLAIAAPKRLRHPPKPILVFAATGDNRLELSDRIASQQGQLPVESATPLGFFQDQVILFWPLLAEQLDLNVQFPLRLRPETEQELATRLWQPELDSGELHQDGVRDYYMVRRSLDLMQLAALSGTPIDDIPTLLKAGMATIDGSEELWDCIGRVLQRWRQWCLDRGLLTYGLVTELFWRYLLPHPTYQAQLTARYRAVLADDVDEYPAIAHSLFTVLLDSGIPGCFTYNPSGMIRWGLGADPDCLLQLANRCHPEPLAAAEDCLGQEWGTAIASWMFDPLALPDLPDSIQSLQTTSRADLLRQMADMIVQAVRSGDVPAQEIAVIGPGLDAIARYTLREILTHHDIAVESLNDQQPLASSPMIQALLTLLALVYPGLGRLLDRDAVAEMLVVLSQRPVAIANSSTSDSDPFSRYRIDPVRAGLLMDHCFIPDPVQPRLSPITDFPRWDRLGYETSHTYAEIRQWIDNQIQQQQQRLIPNPVTLLDRAIQQFLYSGTHLPYDQLAVLRELLETAQHYWDVDARLRQRDNIDAPTSVTVEQFIRLLRDGTITADPYPVRPIGNANQAVTLSTIYQYRANRLTHRWQFWLDAGSALWLTGGGALFGAPLFLQSWSGRLWSAADELEADQRRLQRQVLDLLSRVSDRLILCHSDLATNGQEQTGTLLSLVNRAMPMTLARSTARSKM